jgi:hypothetical protein
MTHLHSGVRIPRLRPFPGLREDQGLFGSNEKDEKRASRTDIHLYEMPTYRPSDKKHEAVPCRIAQ